MSFPTPSPVAVIINPIAGPASRRLSRDESATLVDRTCASADLVGEAVFTERIGHARELAANFARRGCSLVVAWGGDGTVNEVASALAFQDVALGVVPAGSGNGLARELGVSLDPQAALATALSGIDRRIDIGEIGGRRFINVAGVGLAASVAHLFSRLAGRGLRNYIQATLSEVLSYEPRTYVVEMEGVSHEHRALTLEIANGRQYGNGALVAPRAKLDDGRFDVVIVEPMSLLRLAWGTGRLFRGTLDRDRRVRTRTATSVTISSDEAMPYHVDGEPVTGVSILTATVHPAALTVRVPRSAFAETSDAGGA